MSYDISYVPSVAKALRKLDKQVARRIVRAIGKLADQPRPPGCVQLSDGNGELRIRVGDYRVIYEVIDNELVVLVLRVGRRRQIYR